jgi:hypothetical protein
MKLKIFTNNTQQGIYFYEEFYFKHNVIINPFFFYLKQDFSTSIELLIKTVTFLWSFVI